MHVHLLNHLEPAEFQALEAGLAPEILITHGSQNPLPQGVNIFVAGRPERTHLENCPSLQAVVIPFAGLPEPTRILLQEFPHLQVYNLHHNAPQVAEMTIALLLAAAKLLIPYDQALRKNDWSPRYASPRGTLLDGKTCLILGFGAIGQRAGRACHAFGMHILATRRHPERLVPVDYPAHIHSPADMLSLLPQANALIITLPLTDETRGLLGARELGTLPQGAVLVNVGRGPIVDEKALFEALKNGPLSAAGLDVWYTYPSSPETRSTTSPSVYPFHELDNVVMSPHRAGAVIENEDLRIKGLVELINALHRGETPAANRVDLQLGY